MPAEKSGNQYENGQNFEVVNLDGDQSPYLPTFSPKLYPKASVCSIKRSLPLTYIFIEAKFSK